MNDEHRYKIRSVLWKFMIDVKRSPVIVGDELDSYVEQIVSALNDNEGEAA